MKIKTGFWNERKKDMWIIKYLKLSYWLTILSGANLMFFVFNELWFFAVLNGIAFILGILITISYNKYAQKRKNNEKIRNKKDKNTIQKT